jgi:hypothetical protein
VPQGVIWGEAYITEVWKEIEEKYLDLRRINKETNLGYYMNRNSVGYVGDQALTG